VRALAHAESAANAWEVATALVSGTYTGVDSGAVHTILTGLGLTSASEPVEGRLLVERVRPVIEETLAQIDAGIYPSPDSAQAKQVREVLVKINALPLDAHERVAELLQWAHGQLRWLVWRENTDTAQTWAGGHGFVERTIHALRVERFVRSL
jgi:hypothetical protein